MLQERGPLLGVTVELVQSVTIALLVAFLAVAVLVAALVGFAWGKAKIATEKLRAWYAEIATRRVMNDARRGTTRARVMPDSTPPDTLRSGSPQPMRRANTPVPPPLPTIPVAPAGPRGAPPRPRSRPLTPAVELAQTSPDWSDDRRKTQRSGPPLPSSDDPHTRETRRLPRPRPDAEVSDDELDFDPGDGTDE